MDLFRKTHKEIRKNTKNSNVDGWNIELQGKMTERNGTTNTWRNYLGVDRKEKYYWVKWGWICERIQEKKKTEKKDAWTKQKPKCPSSNTETWKGQDKEVVEAVMLKKGLLCMRLK